MERMEIPKVYVTPVLELPLFVIMVSSFPCDEEPSFDNDEEFPLDQNSKDNNKTYGGGGGGGDGGPQSCLPFLY